MSTWRLQILQPAPGAHERVDVASEDPGVVDVLVELVPRVEIGHRLGRVLAGEADLDVAHVVRRPLVDLVGPGPEELVRVRLVVERPEFAALVVPEFEIFIVQPGLSKSTVSQPQLDLVGDLHRSRRGAIGAPGGCHTS